MYSGWEKSFSPIGLSFSHLRINSEFGALPEIHKTNKYFLSSFLTALHPYCAVLGVMREPFQLEVTKNHCLETVMVMNCPSVVDPDKRGVSGCFHQRTLSLIFYKDVRSPDIFWKSIFSFNQFNISWQVCILQALILG